MALLLSDVQAAPHSAATPQRRAYNRELGYIENFTCAIVHRLVFWELPSINPSNGHILSIQSAAIIKYSGGSDPIRSMSSRSNKGEVRAENKTTLSLAI
jgi:hypothetical protein